MHCAPRNEIDYYADSDKIIRICKGDILIRHNDPNEIIFDYDAAAISLRKFFECLDYRDRSVPPEL